MEDISIIQLLLDASLGVKAILIILLALSLYSWSLIFKKTIQVRKVKKPLNSFEAIFWDGKSLTDIYRRTAYEDKMGDIGNSYKQIFQYYKKNTKSNETPLSKISEVVIGEFEVKSQMTQRRLRKNISTLGTISSTSPYIGLLGTVYGILIAFWGLGLEEGASIAQIAPSIAEALIATAMGLFVAIPALVAHNKINNDCLEIQERYEAIADEFLNFINKTEIKEIINSPKNNRSR